MYARIENNIVVEYPILNIRQAFPHVSFPETIYDSLLPVGIVRVTNSPYPQYNPATHKPVARPVPEYVDGTWRTVFDVLPLTEEELANVAAANREQFKAQRSAAVAEIKVTTASGKTFDGDEDSQTRMTRAILALQATGVDSTRWVLANNEEVLVTKDELVEALSLAGAEQTRLWVMP